MSRVVLKKLNHLLESSLLRWLNLSSADSSAITSCKSRRTINIRKTKTSRPDLLSCSTYSAESSSMQDTYHIWTQFNGLALSQFSKISGSLYLSPSAREVMGSIPVRESDFSLFRARVILINSIAFTFHYRAKNSPSWCKLLLSIIKYLALIHWGGGLYGRILTEVVSTDRTQFRSVHTTEFANGEELSLIRPKFAPPLYLFFLIRLLELP